MNVFAKLRALFQKEKLDRDMAEEMRFHLAQRAADHIEDGLSPDNARYAAQRKFGGVEQIKERCRDERARGWVWLEHAIQDVRYAVRTLSKSRGFAAAILVSLALGIGDLAVAFGLSGAIAIATWIPEWRASRVNPMVSPSQKRHAAQRVVAAGMCSRRQVFIRRLCVS